MSLFSKLSKVQVRLHWLLTVLLIASFHNAWVAPAEAQVSGATLSGLGPMSKVARWSTRL